MGKFLQFLPVLLVSALLAGCGQQGPAAPSAAESQGTFAPAATESAAPLAPASSVAEAGLDEAGLTQEEAAQLAAAKDAYEAMSPEDQALARAQERVWCPNFDHLDWETRIDTHLIRYVGEEEFAAWADGRWEQGLCTSIYDLARDFSIPYQEMESLIQENGLEGLYPLERVKARFQALGL